MPAELGLMGRTTSWTVRRGAFRKRPQKDGDAFQDWTVDGTPLRRLLGGLTGVDQAATCLTAGSTAAVVQIDQLLGRSPSDFDADRVALLLCPIDWDVHCGAITAQLVIGENTVEWRQIGWENGLEPEIQLVQPALTITFDRLSYEQTLKGARTRYAPADEAD